MYLHVCKYCISAFLSEHISSVVKLVCTHLVFVIHTFTSVQLWYEYAGGDIFFNNLKECMHYRYIVKIYQTYDSYISRKNYFDQSDRGVHISTNIYPNEMF